MKKKMKEMKFSFCIIDDESSNSRRKGWGRAFELFSKKSYINNINTTLALKDDNDLNMDYKILSPETGYKLTTVKKYLDENHSKHDFFLIDLNLGHEDFVDDYEGFTKKTEYKDIREDEIPLFLAGLSFLNILPKDERPKLFFSGHEKAQEISFYIKILESRLHDTYLESIDDIRYKFEIYKKIDNYLYKCQVQIISRLSFNFREELKKRLQEYNLQQWCSFDIIDRRKKHVHNQEDRYWSIKTLFPRQFNLLVKGQEIEKSKNYIKDILDVDWRKLIGRSIEETSGLLDHPKGIRDIEQVKKMAVEIDFEPSKKIYKPMTKLPGFKGNCENLRSGIVHGTDDVYKIQYDNGTQHRELTPVKKYFASIYNAEKESDDFDLTSEIENWCTNIGIYPIDIAYISHIAFDNKRHSVDGKAPEFNFSVLGDDYDQIIFTWKYGPPNEICRDFFCNSSQLYFKFKNASKNRNNLEDEGFSDIIKIALWRYNGVVEFQSGEFSIKAQRGEKEPIDIALENNPDSIDGTQLKISILPPEK